MRIVTFLFVLILSISSQADWHHGTVDFLAIGYDGKTISIGQAGFSGKNCTCYKPWPNRYCLNTNRDTHDKEYAFLLSARARNKTVAINIDEATCSVIAMYEN